MREALCLTVQEAICVAASIARCVARVGIKAACLTGLFREPPRSGSSSQSRRAPGRLDKTVLANLIEPSRTLCQLIQQPTLAYRAKTDPPSPESPSTTGPESLTPAVATYPVRWQCPPPGVDHIQSVTVATVNVSQRSAGCESSVSATPCWAPRYDAPRHTAKRMSRSRPSTAHRIASRLTLRRPLQSRQTCMLMTAHPIFRFVPAIYD
ncbi:hypothetical protein OKW43_004989 [Paraburkholderia sp. WC7.3g]